MRHRKTKKTKSAMTSREYKIAFKNCDVFCVICNRKVGIFDAYCGPSQDNLYKKPRNWKSYRRTQYKIKTQE